MRGLPKLGLERIQSHHVITIKTAPTPRATRRSLGTRGGTTGSTAPRARRRAPPSWATLGSSRRTPCTRAARRATRKRSSTCRRAVLREARRAQACAHRCEHESTWPPTETSLVSHTMQPSAGTTFMRRRVFSILRGAKISHQSWPNGSLAAQSSLPWTGATWSAREPSVGLGAGHGWSSRG